MNDGQLLRQFVERKSESAYRALMERHAGLVFGTAQRITGSSALAEDVAQTVFLLLADKARKLPADVSLTGWLYRTTRFVAARALRSEWRRTRREQEAAMMNVSNAPNAEWQRVAPKLDEAMARLGEMDRSAILHRFLEQRSLREVGGILGVSEEAAKKRVARAVEKLRRILVRRGIDLSAGALMAGLTQEAAALPTEIAAKLAASTLTKLSTADATGLLADVIAAMRWAKIKLVGTAVIGVTVAVLLLPRVAPLIINDTRPHQRGARAEQTTADNATASSTESIIVGIEGLPHRTVRLTVLDNSTGTPIRGADVTHTLMSWGQSERPPAPIRTDANGVAELRIPEGLPEPIPMEQFQAWVRATDYAPRSAMWLSTTGGVLAMVTNDYTVRLERGITLSGTLVDESGKPLSGVIVGTVGNSYRGYSTSRDQDGKVTSPPEFRNEIIEEYSFPPSASGPDAMLSNYEGRFEMPHYPTRLEALQMQFVLPDGARHKVRTPSGKRLSTEALPEVLLAELKAGTARIVIPRGLLVEGTVVGANGKPIPGAIVTESVLIGNLKVLSRNHTDALGQFRLENRSPREIILSAMAAGHAGLSQLVSIAPGMKAVRLQLQPEPPLRGMVLDESGAPISAHQ